DHGQTQPQSAMLPRGTSVCLPETFEHMGQELGKDTIAGVLDDDFSIAAGGFQAQLDVTIQGSELDCIGKQVPDDLLQAITVAHNKADRIIDLDIHGNTFRAGSSAHTVESSRENSREIDSLPLDYQFPGQDAGHIQEVFNQAFLDFRVSADDFNRVSRRT